VDARIAAPAVRQPDESRPVTVRPPGRWVTVRYGSPPRRPVAIPVSSGSLLTTVYENEHANARLRDD